MTPLEEEVRAILSRYEARYISRANLHFMLMENPNDYLISLSRQARMKEITMTMKRLGWKPYSFQGGGAKNRNRCVASYIRAA